MDFLKIVQQEQESAQASSASTGLYAEAGRSQDSLSSHLMEHFTHRATSAVA